MMEDGEQCQYYPSPAAMFSRDYPGFLPPSYGPMESTCVYGTNSKSPQHLQTPAPGTPYGCHSMTVVDNAYLPQGGAATQAAHTPHAEGHEANPHLNGSHHPGRSRGFPPHTTALPPCQPLSAPMPAHIGTLAGRGPSGPNGARRGPGPGPGLALQQPPPAHQNHPKSAGGKGGGKGGEGGKPPLHFPWMKTTKSHAHQWKANWAGKEVMSGHVAYLGSSGVR